MKSLSIIILIILSVFIFADESKTTVRDSEPPYTDLLNPGDGDAGVPVNSNITFHIYDDVDGVDINSINVEINSSNYSVSSGYFFYSGDVFDYFIVINPPVDFPFGGVVDVQIDGEDLVGNVMPSLNYSFTCLNDTQPPYVGLFDPAPGSVDVPIDSNIMFHIFDSGEGVNLNSVAVTVEGSVYDVNDTQFFSYTGNSLEYIITIDLPDFQMGDVIDVQINGVDLGGMPMETYSYSFTCIEDNDAPFTAEWQPAPNSIGVPVDTDIMFNIYDNISGVNLDSIVVVVDGIVYTEPLITFNYDNIENGYHITINPVDDFIFGQTVNVSIDAEDYNNPPNEMTTFNYSFECERDTDPPYIGNYQPLPGSEYIPIDTNIEFYVFDDILGVDINSLLVDVNGTDYSVLIGNLTATMIGSENIYSISINPTNNFDYGEVINVVINASDLASPVNWLNNFAYSFKCIDDIDTPFLGEFDPIPNSFGVQLDEDITFHIYDSDYGVDINTVVVEIQGSISPLNEYSLANGNLYYSGNVNDYFIRVDPVDDFEYGELINVQINASDLSTPPFEMGTFSFSLQCVGFDLNPPFIWNPDPADQQTDVPVETDISVYILDGETGVDEQSIILRINGVEISDFQKEEVVLFQGPGYQIIYDPPVSFNYGEVVTVNVEADDLAAEINSFAETYSFVCEDNIPPVIILPDNISFREDETLDLDFSQFIHDANGDSLELSVFNNLDIIVSIDQFLVTFSAPSNWNGSEFITFTVDDLQGREIASDEVEVIVIPVNDDPGITLPDNFSFNEDNNIIEDFDNYISDIDNDELSISFSGNTYILIEINESNNEVTLASHDDWFGTETITFFVNDLSGRPVVSDDVEIIVSPVNDPPTIILPDSYIFNEDEELIVDFSPFIDDIDGDIPVLSYSDNSNVIISITDHQVTFSAQPDWFGSEIITFTVDDNQGRATASDDIEIIVLPDNDAPTFILPDDFTFDEDGSLMVDFDNYIEDIDDNDFTISVSGNANIIVEIDNIEDEVTFSAPENWNGAETLTFFVDDNSSRAVTSDDVLIIVNALNDAPTIQLPNSLSFEEDDIRIVDFGSYIADIDGDSLELSATGNVNIIISISGSEVTFSSQPDWNGSEIITFTVDDNQGRATASDVIEIIVTSGNDAPTIILPENFSFPEDSTLVVDFNDYIDDPENDDLFLSVSGNTHTIIDIDQANNILTFSAIENWNGTESLIFYVNDDRNRLVASDVADLIVTPVNDAPTIELPDDFVFNEDDGIVVNFIPYIDDIDDDVLEISESGSDNVVININVYEVTFSAQPDWSGTEIITFTVNDNQERTVVSDSVEIIVTPVNDAPTLILPDNFTLFEDSTLTVDFNDYFIDIDNTEFTISVSGNAHVSVEIDGFDNDITFGAENNWNGTEILTFYVNDNSGRAVAIDDVEVIVTPVNDIPTISIPDSLSFTEDEILVMNFASFVYDIDGDDLELSVSSNINVLVSIDGYQVTFESQANWNGEELITFTIDDGQGRSTASDDILITVLAGNDSPEIGLPDSFSFGEDGSLTEDFDPFISDPDNDELYLSYTGNANVIIEINEPENEVMFTALENWFGIETITFYVNDLSGRAVASDEIDVIVTPVNDLPVISLPDSLVIMEDDFFSVSFSQYISDVENDIISLSVLGNENITVDIDGYYVTFGTADNWFGEETISFKVDDNEFSDLDEIKIIALGINDPPIFILENIPAYFEFPENSSLEVDFADYIMDYEQSLPELTLSYSGNNFIDVNVSGLMVTFSNKTEHWSGSENILFSVDDNQSRETTEMNIKVVVIPKTSEEKVIIEPHTISWDDDFCEIFIYSKEAKNKISGKIFNRRGKLIKNLNIEDHGDNKRTTWDKRDKNSNPVSGGFYLYQLNVNGRIFQGSIIVAR
ncbi:MAG: tandem-95 repeat protein [Candidatus Cloacimonetes bacterium]|nr:tandem-95 repeat protein [Candidatus Cloacimonadota bacterium]